jgi:hypothetical protein
MPLNDHSPENGGKEPGRDAIDGSEDIWGRMGTTHKALASAVFLALIYCSWLLIRWLMA